MDQFANVKYVKILKLIFRVKFNCGSQIQITTKDKGETSIRQIKLDQEASGNHNVSQLTGGDIIQEVLFQGGRRVASANGPIAQHATVTYREGSYTNNYLATNSNTKPDQFQGTASGTAKIGAQLEKDITFGNIQEEKNLAQISMNNSHM